MRLQLIARLLLPLAIAAPARAAADDPEAPNASATLRVYADDDRVTVVSPSAHATLATAGDGLGISVDVTADAITAASIDVITSASPATVHETRLETDLAATARHDRLALTLGGSDSHEHDHDALRAQATAALDLARRNTTLALTLRAGRDRDADVTDPTFHGERTLTGATLDLTQLVDRRTIIDLTIDASLTRGWQGNPYRRVLVEMAGSPLPLRVREATPDRRAALALALRGRRAVGDRWFATAIARGYLDEWSVASATTTVELRRALAGGRLAGLVARGYLQRGADFRRRHYLTDDASAPPPLRTADRTLGPMADLQLELALDQPLGARAHLLAALGALHLWFLDDPAQHARTAATLTISLSLPL